MASRAHLRRNTSTPPPGGYGGDGTDDDQSRTSEVTGDQGRAARDESDASVSPRAWELYCTEAWVGDFPRAMYPDGDLGIKKLAEFFQTDHLHSTLCDDPVLSRVLLLFNLRVTLRWRGG